MYYVHRGRQKHTRKGIVEESCVIYDDYNNYHHMHHIFLIIMELSLHNLLTVFNDEYTL